MATVRLYSVKEQALVDFELSTDANGEILATYNDEFQKFPGGLNKEEFLDLVEQANKVNESQVPLTDDEVRKQEENAKQNDKLFDELS